MGSKSVELPALDSLTCFNSATLKQNSTEGQKVSNPNDKNEQSPEVLQDDHISATEKLKKLSETIAGTSARNVGGNARAHTVQTDR